MSLDCGRKPEYLVRTHACTGRTCKLHAERPPAGSRTLNTILEIVISKKLLSVLNSVYTCCLCALLQLFQSAGLPGHKKVKQNSMDDSKAE
ncbi:hypothetical protein ILYODFUR_004442 [Ilyodon furcidens]|uniref:Uncharacterized protein n=1 Tax=Ilyodon furcidens TaxID=33524 RepID=A0ABV0SIE3_9TELE